MSNRRYPANPEDAAYPLDRGYAPSTTSGCARRRRKAIQRRDWLLDLDVRWAFRLNRVPRYAAAVSYCSCGRTSWLMPPAWGEQPSRDDFDDFYAAENDHSSYCQEVVA